MAIHPAPSSPLGGGWDTIVTLTACEGSAAHPMCARLMEPTALLRDVADAVHALCILHGRHPGLIDHAFTRNAMPGGAGWLEEAVAGFALERAVLAKLVAAVGPMPSTPGQADSEAIILAQRHALDTLAQSDRGGCAIGAAIAFVGDWSAIRPVLDRAAERLGLAPTAMQLPDMSDTATVVATIAAQPGPERAMMFGAQQVLAQHHGLWTLLEARALARNNV
jgi:hypothetical protein